MDASWRRRRRDRDVPRGSVAASVGVHLLGAALLLLGSATVDAPPRLETYRVQLVAASAERAPERERPSPATQEERPEPEEQLPDPELEEQPEPEPEIDTRRATPEPPPEVEPARSDEKEGAESVNVELDGEIFPYPGYLENIIRQVHRYWRPPAEKRALRAELSFVIHRDGTVSDIQWIRRSGDPTFDLEARGAIEAAGRQEAFGSLPEDYPRDRLRVSFFFDPSQR